jgi:hypothetical protein
MLVVNTNKVSPTTVLVESAQFNLLVEQARKAGQVTVNEVDNDLPIDAIMKLQEKSGAFEFLNRAEEDIYTVNDVKVCYR